MTKKQVYLLHFLFLLWKKRTLRPWSGFESQDGRSLGQNHHVEERRLLASGVRAVRTCGRV